MMVYVILKNWWLRAGDDWYLLVTGGNNQEIQATKWWGGTKGFLSGVHGWFYVHHYLWHDEGISVKWWFVASLVLLHNSITTIGGYAPTLLIIAIWLLFAVSFLLTISATFHNIYMYDHICVLCNVHVNVTVILCNVTSCGCGWTNMAWIKTKTHRRPKPRIDGKTQPYLRITAKRSILVFFFLTIAM